MHETCLQYVARRLVEGWEILSQSKYEVILISPEGFRRPVDLRNDIETLRPDAVGAETNISFATGLGDHYEEVNEVDDNKYVYQRANWARDLYGIPNHSVGSGIINKVTVYVRCQRETGFPGNGYGKAVIRSNTTITEGSQQEPPIGSWLTLSEIWTTNPADGVWKWSDIDALQIGVALLGSATHSILCSENSVEIDFTKVIGPFPTFFRQI